MNDPLDQELDSVLGEHLRTRLQPQQGRATEAFARHLRQQRTWRITFTTAAAAMITIAALVAWERLSTSPVSPAPRFIASLPAPAAPESAQPVIHQASWSRLQDDGLRMIDDQPVRQLRRSFVEQFEWYDQSSKAVVRTTVPREQIILIGVRTD